MLSELDDSSAMPGRQIAQYAPSGLFIVTASGASATVWDTRTGQKQRVLSGHKGLIQSVVYGPGGQQILTTSIDKTARLWDAETGQLLAVFRGHPKGLQSAMYSPQGDRMLTVGSDAVVHVWDSASEQMVAELKSPSPISCVTYSPDGRRVLIADMTGAANLWDASQETRSPEEIGDLLRCYVPMRFISPDSSILISANPEPEHCQSVATANAQR
jgi:WD40 repeat protein